MIDLNDSQDPPRGAAPGPEGGGGPSGIIDWDGLKRRYRNNPAFVRRIAEATLKANRDVPARLRQWAAAGDLAEIGRVAHALKSDTGNLMALGTCEFAERVQVAARGGAADSLALALALADALDALLAELTTVLRLDQR